MLVVSAAAVVSATLAGGCAPTVTEESVSMGASFSDAQAPLILSSRPKEDAAAYNHSERTLAPAHWEAQQELAPRPRWEQVPTPRGMRMRRAEEQPVREVTAADLRTGRPVEAEAAPDDVMSRRAATPFALPPAEETPAAAEPVVEDAEDAPRAIPVAATAGQPTTAPAVPAVGAEPVELQVTELAGVPQEEPLPLDLPMTVDALAGGNVRVIWSLRHYGGPGVTSKVNGGTSRRDVTLSTNDLAPIVQVINQHLGNAGSAVALPSENRLVIVCPAAEYESLLRLLDRLDRPQPQVEIAAKIFEVSQDFDYQQGARLLLSRVAADGAQTGLSSFNANAVLESITKGTPLQGSVVSLMQTFADAGLSVDASFQLLADAGMIEVVSSPRLTVAEGQTGYMLAGQELPIQSASFQDQVLKTTTEYKPVGVQLYITPQAVGPDNVKLHTVSIVSNVSGFAPLPDLFGHGKAKPVLVNPIIESREAETAVTVADGNTLVISGMRMIRTTTREEKVPGLGDLPILGNLFKNHRSQQRMTDLYFFITPTLAYMEE